MKQAFRIWALLLCLGSSAGASRNSAFDEIWFSLTPVTPVSGSTFIWYGTVDVAWTNQLNWTNILTGANGEPSTNDTAIFNNAGNSKINIGYDGGFRAVKNIIATNSAMAAYTLGSNVTERINWTPDGSITMYGNAGNNLTMGGNIHVGSSSGEVTNYITCYSKTKAIGFSQGNSQLEATNGNVVLVFNTVSNNGSAASINMAGQWKKTSGNITKVIKQGVGWANVGSGTPGNTTISDYYLNEGALSFVGDQANLINGNRLFINTNTHLICANRPLGNFTGITNYWNGDFSFGSSGYGAAINQMTFGAGGLVELGQYGSDAVRTISVSNGTFTINCTITNGSNGITTGLKKIGTGTLGLSWTNTFSGGFTLGAGVVQLNNSHCLGTGTFTIDGGTVVNVGAGAVTINNNPITINSNFTFGSSVSSLNLGPGNVSLTTNVTITTANSVTYTIAGIISGSGRSLTKAGAGANAILVLQQSNTYDGGTYVNAGTLRTSTTNCILASSAVYITNNAVMNLNFIGTNQIDKLYLAGTSVVSAVYGMTNAVSTNFLTGTGYLSVTNGP